MELSGVMLHARVLIFCLFFMGVRKNIFVFPEYIITLRARSIKKLTCSRIAISRSDATFHIRGHSHWSEGSDQWEIFSDELYGTMSMKMEAPATHSGNEGDKSAENVSIDH